MSTSIIGPWTTRHESLAAERAEKELQVRQAIRVLCVEGAYEEACGCLGILEQIHNLSKQVVDDLLDFILKHS